MGRKSSLSLLEGFFYEEKRPYGFRLSFGEFVGEEQKENALCRRRILGGGNLPLDPRQILPKQLGRRTEKTRYEKFQARLRRPWLPSELNGSGKLDETLELLSKANDAKPPLHPIDPIDALDSRGLLSGVYALNREFRG